MARDGDEGDMVERDACRRRERGFTYDGNFFHHAREKEGGERDYLSFFLSSFLLFFKRERNVAADQGLPHHLRLKHH